MLKHRNTAWQRISTKDGSCGQSRVLKGLKGTWNKLLKAIQKESETSREPSQLWKMLLKKETPGDPVEGSAEAQEPGGNSPSTQRNRKKVALSSSLKSPLLGRSPSSTPAKA